jgi:hypothetical protein
MFEELSQLGVFLLYHLFLNLVHDFVHLEKSSKLGLLISFFELSVYRFNLGHDLLSERGLYILELQVFKLHGGGLFALFKLLGKVRVKGRLNMGVHEVDASLVPRL